MGILVELCGVWMVVLIACWSQKHRIFGQNMVKSLQNEALGESGNKCLLRRFEASPTHYNIDYKRHIIICIDLCLQIR